MNCLSAAVCCVLMLASVGADASGQSARSTTFSVAGGVTTLTAESRQLREEGGHLQLGLSRRLESAFSSRLQMDVGYHSIPGVASPGSAMPRADVWVATGSVVKEVVNVRSFRPYVLAGGGALTIDQGSGQEVHMNVTGGAGVVLPPIGRIRPFVEGRFNRALTGMPNTFIPLTFGISF